MYQEASDLLPKPQDVDKCPRCNAEGFIGSCSSCGYNTGILVLLVVFKIGQICVLVFSTTGQSIFAHFDSHPLVTPQANARLAALRTSPGYAIVAALVPYSLDEGI
ncbi:hypothetical protein N431DRAFT_555276 [Stipitochalara longipes BDJ]|nr:hypothetical protein N431DRAFT_555276 [Stipitochalara longipes BDJ]